jgi:hypothetical protein
MFFPDRAFARGGALDGLAEVVEANGPSGVRAPCNIFELNEKPKGEENILKQNKNIKTR